MKKYFIVIYFWCLFVIPCFASGPLIHKPVIAQQQLEIMGSQASIKLRVQEAQLPAAQSALEEAVAQMNFLVSVFTSRDPNSDVSSLNSAAGQQPIVIRPELMKVLQKANEISELSDGAFDITFSTVGQLWKIRPVMPVIPTDGQIAAALGLVNYRQLVLKPESSTAFLQKEGMRIDLGGIAQGTIADAVAVILKQRGFDDFLINVSGDIRVNAPADCEPWIVGVSNPRDPQGPVLGEITLQSGAVVTSGDYEKSVVIDGKRYHHILNPRTGRPTEGCISVTVIGPDTETIDGLSTAFFVMGPEKGMQLCERLEGIEAMFVKPDFEICVSSGFPKFRNPDAK